MDHGAFTAATNCASCHNAKSATGKSASHIPVGHDQLPQLPQHQQLEADQLQPHPGDGGQQCASCHSGGFPPAVAKPVTHTPYDKLSGVSIANCDTCHKGGTKSWTPSKLHANVSLSNQCATCHEKGDQASADGRHLRDLPQGQRLGRRQGESQRLYRGDQLRQLSQRHRGHRQVGHAHSGRSRPIA